MPEISRRQFAVYLVAVVLVVLLGGRALRAGPDAAAGSAAGFTSTAEPGTGPDGEASGGTGSTGAGGVAVVDEGTRVLVHVAGRVRRPGVYELTAGARIADALEQAGGGRSGADLDALNLAAKLTDGEQILVARRGRPTTAAAPTAGQGAAGASTPAVATAPGAAASGAAGATVNVNEADATQLEALTGVGPAIAAKIVDYRTQNGPFASVEDLTQVSGIGPKTLEGMRAQVTL